MKRISGFVCLAMVAGAFGAMPMAAAAKVKPADMRTRTAVLSAFEPEWNALVGSLKNPKESSVNGMKTVTGEMEGRPVVLMMSGVSMVNAAMNTQALLDRYHIDRIVFSGIAGGLDPALNIGDVVVPEKWVPALDVAMGREVNGKFERPNYYEGRPMIANFGMMFPVGVRAGDDYQTGDYHMTFAVDPEMFKLAQGVAGKLTLKGCTIEKVCLKHTPKIVVGGAGVATTAFIDNAAYRDYLHKTFGASAADMESAAVGQVAYVNKVPYIVFRSLSDLAGGGDGANEMGTFMHLASENSATVVKAFLKDLPPIAPKPVKIKTKRKKKA